ncbi:hypothetical protein SDC9_205307 [bioreactor metagenome]|uniref:Uncharacterized protein n=1 Tax=bioreactor metagenome TaxID=1076179 RepID=A0A645JDI0_9ZZZZ
MGHLQRMDENGRAGPLHPSGYVYEAKRQSLQSEAFILGKYGSGPRQSGAGPWINAAAIPCKAGWASSGCARAHALENDALLVKHGRVWANAATKRAHAP